MSEENKPTEPTTPTTPTLEELQAKINRLKEDNTKLKSSVTNASSDAAEWKKKFRETQTEAERKEAERAEADAAIRAELDGYKNRERVSTYTAKLMGAGYDEATAKSMAANLPEGVGDDFFTGQKSFLEGMKKSAESKALGGQPGISVGGSVKNDEPPVDFDKMTDEEYFKYQREHKK